MARRALAKPRTTDRRRTDRKPTKAHAPVDRFAALDKRLAALERLMAPAAGARATVDVAVNRLDPDAAKAHKLGADLVRAFMNPDHPRVMDGESPLQTLRNLRNDVRRRNGGTFNGEVERPLYRAFLLGVASTVRTDLLGLDGKGGD